MRRRLRLGDAVVDLVRGRLEGPRGTVSLTTREAELLGYLADRPGQDVSRDALLTDVWAYRSTNPTRAVDVAVRRLRAKIEPDPSHPRFLISVAGVGYRFVPSSHSPEPRPPPPQANPLLLPTAPLDAFVGRAGALATLSGWLSDGSRIISVIGPGGAGKTRLVLELARTLMPRPRGGTCLCELSECQSESDMVVAVATALGEPRAAVGSVGEAGTRIGATLARRGELLLLVDNVEQLPHQAASLVSRWCRGAPQLRCLITSRRRLGLRGEVVLDLPPLTPEEAAQLFAHRCLPGVDPGSQVVSDIVRRLEGMPLAVEIAAALHRSLPLDELLLRLQQSLDALVDPEREGRHRSVHAAIQWCWSQLDPHEARALARCAVFRGGFDLDAAEVVLHSDDPHAPWAVDLLQALADRSLVRADPSQPRFGMLASVGAFAAARLAEDGAGQLETHRRHADHYLGLAETLVSQIRSPGGWKLLPELARERNNLMAITRRALEPGLRARAVLALAPVINAQGTTTERASLVDGAVAWAVASSDAALEVRARLERADLRVQLSRGGAEEDLERALELTAAGTQPWWRAHALITQGVQCSIRGEPERAVACQLQAVELARELGDQMLEARALNQLGYAYHRSSELELAGDTLDDALRLSRLVADRWTEAMILGNSVSLAAERGRWDVAEAQTRVAAAIMREVGDLRLLGVLHTNLAMVLARAARWESAEAHLRESLALHEASGNSALKAFDLANLGQLLTQQNRLAEAGPLLDQALALDPDSRRRGTLSRYQGVLCHHLGQLEDAAAWFVRAQTESGTAGHAVGALSASLQLALVRAEQGELGAAAKLASEAATRATEMQLVGILPLAWGHLAVVESLRPGRATEARVAMDEAWGHASGGGWLEDVLRLCEGHVRVAEDAESGAGEALVAPRFETAEWRLLDRWLRCRLPL